MASQCPSSPSTPPRARSTASWASAAALMCAAACGAAPETVGASHPRQAANTASFYVSPAGDDAWSGTLADPARDGEDGPFASLEHARDAVRELRERRTPTSPTLVLIRGGTYRLGSPVVFTPADSGTASAPVVYAAHRDEVPVFSGGRTIGPWVRGADGAWLAFVPGVAEGDWSFSQLFVNGRRRRRARSPNRGYFRTDGPLTPLGDRREARGDRSKKMGFRFREGEVRQWEGWQDMNVVVFHSWTASVHWVADIDESDRALSFTAPSGWPIGYWEKNQRYYVEHVRAALDAPGEWYLDRRAGFVHYRPTRWERLKKAEVVAPVAHQLVRLEGEPEAGLHVEHIVLRGLSFQHSSWELARDRAHDGQAAVSVTGAIYARGARHCRLEDLEVAHVGTYGLWLAEGCQDNQVVRCELHDLGAGGIKIGETSSPKTAPLAATHSVVDNCFIHDGGHICRAGVGVWIGRSSHNKITRNDVCDFDYSGMSVGWSWGYAPSSANHNILAYNHIHHLGHGVLSDMGGIYALGVSPGTVMRGNLVHDIHSYSYGGWGLYTDEGSTGILMERNIVYDTKSGGFHQHYGRENVLRHNVLAFADEGQVIRSREEKHVSFSLERNVIVCDNGLPLGKNWRNGNFRLDSNLYWDTAGNDMLFAGMEFEEWQAQGHDQGSRIADPRFVSARRRDFRLRRKSPLHEMGIEPLDPDQAGLYGDRSWVGKPGRVRHRPLYADMKPAQRPVRRAKLREVRDTFEKTKVGERAAVASTTGETSGAAIRVTDEVAAAGKRSLKFTDAPGLEHDWQPHMCYHPHWIRGRVRGSFDLRLEPGAVFWHEWRDDASPYRVGPSLRFMADGRVRTGDRALTTVPHSTWVHVELTCEAGPKTPGVFELTLTVEGREPQSFTGLPCGHKDWRSVTWIGFVSEATDRAVFYLDNLDFRSLKPGPRKTE